MQGGKKKYLSRRMSLGRHVCGWVTERPGLHLSHEEIADLKADLKKIGQKSLPNTPLDYGVFDEAGDAFDRSLITILYDRHSGEPVAFNSMPILELNIQGQAEEVLHLGLVMVDPDARSGGLSSILYGFACILLLIRRQFRPIWVSSVTQVPAVVGLVSELYSNTFPSPNPKARRSFTHLQIARRIMQGHRSAFGVGDDAGFDEQNFVISNAYTGGSDNLKKTFENTPKHRKQIYNDLCAQELNYDRGDDFLQIGQLDIAAVRNYLIRKDKDAPVLGPMIAIAFFSLQSIFIPIIYWFDDRKNWGNLRPWKQ